MCAHISVASRATRGVFGARPDSGVTASSPTDSFFQHFAAVLCFVDVTLSGASAAQLAGSEWRISRAVVKNRHVSQALNGSHLFFIRATVAACARSVRLVGTCWQLRCEDEHRLVSLAPIGLLRQQVLIPPNYILDLPIGQHPRETCHTVTPVQVPHLDNS